MHRIPACLWSFVRAVFWSGGVYWRIPFFLSIFPVLYKEDVWDAPMFGQWLSSWHWYMISLASLILVLGIRLAMLETERVAITFENRHPYIRIYDVNIHDVWTGNVPVCACFVKIKNSSYKDIDNCSVKITSLTDEYNEDVCEFIPAALSIEDEGNEDREGRFNLSPGEEIFVSVVSLEHGLNNFLLVIHYESQTLPNSLPIDRKYLMEITAFGAGKPVSKKFLFSVDEEHGMLAFGEANDKRINWGRFNFSRIRKNEEVS